ncbi:MAG TPA: 2-oxoacid:acceptor oxidoreductase family protein, partial [Candidatus Cloacimonadota bacterium]|nr:2-oxoacid:acceptor oxidoreductase family protein [Candidatus Cloacimonadota bacterium]
KAGMKEGKNVSWLPSYGPEMRGGTANVSTVISEAPIASPIISFPDILVALNQPSLDKFGPSVKPNGLIIANEDMCPRGLDRDDVRFINVSMSAIANEIGDMKVLNMIAIGLIIGATGIVSYETMEEDLNSFMKAKNPGLLDLNLKAIKKGMELGAQAK